MPLIVKKKKFVVSLVEKMCELIMYLISDIPKSKNGTYNFSKKQLSKKGIKGLFHQFQMLDKTEIMKYVILLSSINYAVMYILLIFVKYIVLFGSVQYSLLYTISLYLLFTRQS